MSTVHFMSINICINATDLYLKLITERHGGKNYVEFMKIRQFIERIFTFMYMCQACAECFSVFCVYKML